MAKIIYIADPEILAIPIIECNEALIDVKQSNQLNYGPPPECEATADCYTKIRKTVLDKLLQAQQDLPKGWSFRLYEGFRSIPVQQMLFDNEYQKVVARYPNEDAAMHFHETTRLVSPVVNFDGSINTPAHNTGGAVDIEILTANGELLDMGMTAKDWIDVQPELCLTDCDLVSNEVRANRQLLLDLMHAHGFINYPTEWWHFSFGDRYWAYHTKASHAIYGSADPLIQ